MNLRHIFITITLVLSIIISGNTQIVERHSTSLEVYYGYPDTYTLLYRSVLGSQGITRVTTKGQGPFGARFEHVLSRRIGIGLDLWYVNTKITGIYTPNNNISASNVSFTANLARLNALVRVTFHLARHEKFDPYVHVGLGYLYSQFNFQSSSRSNRDNPLLPISARAGMGLKYYFTPEIGAVVDVGFGGPFISVGFFKRWLKKDENN